MALILNQQDSTTTSTLLDIATKKDSIVSLSSLVSEQLPNFVNADHPRMVAFLEAYYEWMQQKDETLYSTFVLKDFSDIDDTMTAFVEHFKSQYLEGFPKALAYDKTTNSLVDEKRLIKRIKEFYRAKGTEKSYKLLLKILYDADADNFYYPKNDLLKASYGNWINPTTIKTSIVHEADLWLTKDTSIYQKTQDGDITATAMVRNITKYENSQATIAELTIDEISGKFTDDKVINFNTGSTIFEESVYSMISSIGLSAESAGGSGYAVGEKIKIITSTGGTDAIGEIVTVNNNGGIIGIDVINSGLAYRDSDDITFSINSLRGVNAGLTASVDVVTVYPGYYFNTHGHPSSNKKLFDNYYYQDFSYEIRTDMAIKTYKNAVLDLIHPAGTKLFNQVLIKNTHSVVSKYRTQAKPFEISVLGHYTPYTWNTVENLRHNTQGIDLYPFGHNPDSGRAKAQIGFGLGVPGIAQVGEGDHIFLEATDGQKVIVNILGSSGTSTSSATSGTTLDCKTFASGGYANTTLHATAQAVELATVINYHTKFSASNTGITVDITQAVGGAEGNNTITAHEIGATGAVYIGFYDGVSGGAVVEDGVTAHVAEDTRAASYWGLVYNDEPGRTAQSDSITAGNTYAFNYNVSGSTLATGITWDGASGTTGPLYHLSQGLFFTADNSLSGASSSYYFLGTADAGNFNHQGSYWVVYPHPNSRGITNISAGTTFSSVLVEPFFFIDRGETGGIITDFSTNTPT
tara:strand:+ start:499 stop:2742 length:2244 start_codon:yes stop_codon:yes gene_type:complete